MFHKPNSSTLYSKKDAPLRKSDRRKLRDRLLDTLFIGEVTSSSSDWISNVESLIDDAFVGSGDVLCRKLKLTGSGEHVTLFLRTASENNVTNNRTTLPSEVPNNLDDLMNAFPTAWPYCQTTQPLLLEYEDADRKIHLVPLIPLLSAIPPPPSSPSLIECDNSTHTHEHTPPGDTNNRKYRIPSITIHAAVSKFLCRGADLMKSVIRSFPPPWELRQSKGVVCITAFGNPQVLAVGFIEKSLLREYCYKKHEDWRSVACNLVGPEKKGVGVTIVSCYGDDLWKSSQPVKVLPDSGVVNPLGGGRYDDGDYGNVGFQNGCVVCPLTTIISEEDIGIDKGDDMNKIDDACDAQVTADAVGIEQLNISEQIEEAEKKTSPADSQHKATSEIDHDVILEAAFYTSLIQLLVSKTPLPMPVSTYSGKHLMAAVPISGPRLDIKQTSFKKIGPFLLEMESRGVIKLGSSKDKKDRCAFLVGIEKQHPDLVAFKRQWKKDKEESGLDPTTGNDKRKLAVVDLFVVPRHISDKMQLAQEEVKAMNAKTEERKGTGFLTKTECRAIIDGYIESEGLVDPQNKGKILVNGPICDALYRPSKKNKASTEDASYPTSVTRKELIDLWMSKMDAGHAIVEMPGSRILNLAKGEPKPVDIEVEFRQGNKKKFLTRIRGMEEYGIDAELLSNDVSQRFACSSSVETNPVGRAALKKGRAELVFQGMFFLSSKLYNR